MHDSDWARELVRKEPGDHRRFRHPTKPGKVTVDAGKPKLPTGTLRGIYRRAGWEW